MRDIAFLSGLPRSGSTVLASILSQHPGLYASKTSVIYDMIVSCLRYRLGESPYYDIYDNSSPIWSIASGILKGGYSDIAAEKLVLDKNRGWPLDIPSLQKILKKQPKIIATVRHVPEVISSFILLSRKIGPSSIIDQELVNAGLPLDDRNRARIIWEKYVYSAWKALKIGLEYDPSAIHLVDYNELVNEPERILGGVATFLNTDQFEFSNSNIINPNPEKDEIYGLPGLHDVRSSCERTSPPAIDILGHELYELWAKKNLDFWRG